MKVGSCGYSDGTRACAANLFTCCRIEQGLAGALDQSGIAGLDERLNPLCTALEEAPTSEMET